MRQPRCPLCDALVDGDDSLRDHLAAVHDLEDDPGTRTTLEHLDRDAAAEAAAHPSASALLVDSLTPPAVRVYDPDVDDERWRPIAIGVGGLLLLIFTVVALSLQL